MEMGHTYQNENNEKETAYSNNNKNFTLRNDPTSYLTPRF